MCQVLDRLGFPVRVQLVLDRGTQALARLARLHAPEQHAAAAAVGGRFPFSPLERRMFGRVAPEPFFRGRPTTMALQHFHLVGDGCVRLGHTEGPGE
jgi:hypothetical protein